MMATPNSKVTPPADDSSTSDESVLIIAVAIVGAILLVLALIIILRSRQHWAYIKHQRIAIDEENQPFSLSTLSRKFTEESETKRFTRSSTCTSTESRSSIPEVRGSTRPVSVLTKNRMYGTSPPPNAFFPGHRPSTTSNSSGASSSGYGMLMATPAMHAGHQQLTSDPGSASYLNTSPHPRPESPEYRYEMMTSPVENLRSPSTGSHLTVPRTPIIGQERVVTMKTSNITVNKDTVAPRDSRVAECYMDMTGSYETTQPAECSNGAACAQPEQEDMHNSRYIRFPVASADSKQQSGDQTQINSMVDSDMIKESDVDKTVHEPTSHKAPSIEDDTSPLTRYMNIKDCTPDQQAVCSVSEKLAETVSSETKDVEESRYIKFPVVSVNVEQATTSDDSRGETGSAAVTVKIQTADESGV